MADINNSIRKAVSILNSSTESGRRQKSKRGKVNWQEDELAVKTLTTRWRTSANRSNSSLKQRENEAKASPYLRFKRAARAIKMLVQVCKVCKTVVFESVVSEEWYKLVDTLVDSETTGDLSGSMRKKGRPFITFMPNEKRELEQLTFDASEYSREYRHNHLLTEEVRNLMRVKPSSRTIEQQKDLIQFLKSFSMEFCAYPLVTQRRLVKVFWYDVYQSDRVITRQGLQADGVYFVLSGTLVEKTDDKKSLSELKAGDRFGEEDIVCACARRTTVLTKTECELITIHRLDYRAIFNMSDDSNNPRHLIMCKTDSVFQHFPLSRLIENPSVWCVLSYRLGRLMVRDSNDSEWIYVIKSGEAKVIKHISAGFIDMHERRKKIKARLNAEDPYHQIKRLIGFIGDSDSLKSSSHTECSLSPKLRHIKSAPPRSRRTNLKVRPLTSCLPKTSSQLQRKTSAQSQKHSLTNSDIESYVKNTENTNLDHSYSEEFEDLFDLSELKNRQYLKTGNRVKLPEVVSTETKRKSCDRRYSDAGMKMVPPFVQLESLHAGKTFGLRACLSPEDMGSSASLVSAGCEVVQISRKFFMKYADESLLGLIKVQSKAYPSEEELIDRLDANMQWDEYKQSTVSDFFSSEARRIHRRIPPKKEIAY